MDAAHEHWGFDGAVMVSWKGRILLARGYGYANQEFEEPNTPETRFFIGSITKQFTAAAILNLRDKRLLNINDPIYRYLTDYPREAAKKVTIFHLLTHTSGIPDYTRNISVLLRRTDYMSPSDLINIFKDEPLEFEPGEKFQYSNSNYILLGEIIEGISGQSFEAYLNREILKPSGMLNTGYARREAGIPNRADGYTIEDKEAEVGALSVHFSILHSAGAMYSTVMDMYLWDQALHTDEILSDKSVSEMFRPDKFGNGYGWIIESRYGRRHAYHGGFLDGFNSIIDRWMDDGICIVVFSNEDEAPVTKIARGIAAILFGKPHVMPIRKTAGAISPEIIREYEGVYRAEAGFYRIVSLENDSLFTHLRGQRRETLLPQAPDTFFFASDHTKNMIFFRSEAGGVAGNFVLDDGQRITAMKLSEPEAAVLKISRTRIDLPPGLMTRYTGLYKVQDRFGPERNSFLVKVAFDRGYLTAAITETETIRLWPSSETDYFMENGDFQISFIVDENDEVLGCMIIMGDLTVQGIKIE